MLFLKYTILVTLQLYKGIATVVPDPSPDYIQNSHRVADMCKASSATEHTFSEGNDTGGVVLRISMQQNNCICRVTLENQTKATIFVDLMKYDCLTSSAPEKAGCGLAVDINHIPDMSTRNASIECLMNGTRQIPLLQKSYLQFRSRIINGSFIRGFCMRIIQENSNDHSQLLRIDCDAPMATEQTTEKITSSDAPQSSPHTPVSEKSTTSSSNIDTTSTVTTEKSTTNSSNIDTTTIVTTTNVKHQSITTATDTTTGHEQTTYIAIGAGSGVALILLVVLVVICLRRKSTQKAETNGYDDKLPDSVLYVPGREFDITAGK